MIQHRKSDGSLGQFGSDKVHSITTDGNKFTVKLKHYGWDEYDFWYETIDDIIEMRV